MEFDQISDEEMEAVFDSISDQDHQKKQKEITYTESPEHKKSSSKKKCPQRRIDLHGLHVEEALNRVEQFIKNCHLDQIQFALIITGKGLHSQIESNEGVLKRNVRIWLERHHIIFQDAPRHLGGSGAFWIKFH